MTDFSKMDDQQLENVAGGYRRPVTKTVANLESGYLAVRTAPSYHYENEIPGSRLHNGDLVEITGDYVRGTGVNGVPCTYVWVYVLRTGMAGYVNAYYLS